MCALRVVEGSAKVEMFVGSTGKLKAYASVALGVEGEDRMIVLNKMKVYDGSQGLFVSFPNDPSHKGEDYRQIYYPVTRELRNEIEFELLSVFRYEEMRQSGCWVTGELAVGLVEANDAIERRAFALAMRHGL